MWRDKKMRKDQSINLSVAPKRDEYMYYTYLYICMYNILGAHFKISPEITVLAGNW